MWRWLRPSSRRSTSSKWRWFRWRFDELLRAGHADDDVLALTIDREVDLHLAVDLLRRGCPHATAVRILL